MQRSAPIFSTSMKTVVLWMDGPEQVFAHAVEDDLISRKQLQRLLVTVKKLLNAAHRVQLFCPLEESEPEGLLEKRWDKNLVPNRVSSSNCSVCIVYRAGFQCSMNTVTLITLARSLNTGARLRTRR